MPADKGRRIALTPSRKMMLEIVHHGRKVPGVPIALRMQLGPLVQARQAAKISWNALFMKAYGLIALKRRELRQAYIRWPWPHIYEHSESACAVMLERDLDGENVVLGSKVRGPENQSLTDLDAMLRRLRTAPIQEISSFRQMLRVGRLPGIVRRFLFWQTLNVSGFTRAKRLGTFAISTLGNHGAFQCHPISPLTTYLVFGPVAPTGEVEVRIVYDHRVTDGRTIGRCLNDLEHTLNTVIVEELRTLPLPLAA